MTQKELIEKIKKTLISDNSDEIKVTNCQQLIFDYEVLKTDRPRCKMCANWGTIDYWGRKKTPDDFRRGTKCCPFKPNEKRKGTFKMLPACTNSCEYFKIYK